MTIGVPGVTSRGMYEAIIETQTKDGKGRSFRAMCLATVEADSLWPGGLARTDNIRPVWTAFAGTENELRPFMANLILGRKADLLSEYRRREDVIELLKSAGYQQTWQREEEGCIATAFLPDLFRLDPGMVDPAGAFFVLLPTREWFAKQKLDVNPIVEHGMRLAKLRGYPVDEGQLITLAPVAYLFCAYLDRRTRCPLLADGRFYLQILLACLSEGLATWSIDKNKSYFSYGTQGSFGQHTEFGFREHGTEELGFLPGVAFGSSHDTLEALLAKEVTEFYTITKG